MHQLPIEQQILEAGQIAALVALCVRLWLSGLYKVYVFFFIFLTFQLLQLLVPVFLSPSALAYRYIYMASQMLILCSTALVILELYSNTLDYLPGIASHARRYLRIFLAVAVGLSLIPLEVERKPDTLTGYLFTFERSFFSSLLILVILITGFLLYFPVPIGRNTVIYLTGYAVYFVGEAATIFFLNNLGSYANRALGSATMALFLCCSVYWLVGLSRKGEDKKLVVGHQWRPSDEPRLMANLEAINSRLLRSSARK